MISCLAASLPVGPGVRKPDMVKRPVDRALFEALPAISDFVSEEVGSDSSAVPVSVQSSPLVFSVEQSFARK